jgi:periplasmic copper chaperone A
MGHMPKGWLAWAVLGLAAVDSSSSLRAQAPEVTAAQGWVRPYAAGQATALAGAVVENTSAYVVYVTAAETDVASRIELRDASKSDPTSQAVKFIAIPAFGSLTMDPEGAHLVLSGLKRPLKAGERVALTLRTDQNLRIPVAATVAR